MAEKPARQRRPSDISLDKAVAGFTKWYIEHTSARTCGPRPLRTSWDMGALVKFEADEPKSLA